MNSSQRPRKQVRHFEDPGHVHELTFSCYQRWPLLTTDTRREMLSHSIDQAIRRHNYHLFALVYMPEHVHLMVFPKPNCSPISQLLSAMKRPFSFRMKKRLEQLDQQLLAKLTVRQRPGVQTFRFWQEGPGYDRNLTEAASIEAAVDYIHRNPVRRGLCERAGDWRWSSARFYYENQNDAGLPTIDRVSSELLNLPH